MPPETTPSPRDPFVLSEVEGRAAGDAREARTSTSLSANGEKGPLRLDASATGFEADFAALVDARREVDEDVSAVVREILADVRKRGDAAVAERTAKFDGHDLEQTGWQIDRAARKAALDGLDHALRDAIELAADRIRTYHAAQKPEDRDHTDAAGVRLGARWSPVDSAGLYVPGGRAAYPSSVLMNALPAKVAGVDRLAMVVPTPKGETDPLVLAAAEIAGVDEVWRIGGAQAVAALAYGTGRIAGVDVIVGPGNPWGAEPSASSTVASASTCSPAPARSWWSRTATRSRMDRGGPCQPSRSTIPPASQSCSPTTRPSPTGWRKR